MIGNGEEYSGALLEKPDEKLGGWLKFCQFFSSPKQENLHKLRGRIDCIESMRTLISTWIVFCHFIGPKEELLQEHMYYTANLLYNNQGSVYGFLVLSGFVTHWTCRDLSFDTLKDAKAFYLRRFTRVIFTYEVTVLLLFLLRCGQGGDSSHFLDTLKTYIIYVFGLQAWFTWSETQVYSGPLFAFSPPHWTLSALAFCWLLYPLVAKYVIGRRSWFYSCFLTCAAIFVGLAHRRVHGGTPNDYAAGWGDFQGYYWFPPYSFEVFVLGLFGAEVAANIPLERAMTANMASVSIDICFVLFLGCNITNWDVEYLRTPVAYGIYLRSLWLLVGCMLAVKTESLFLGSSMCSWLAGFAKYSMAMWLFQMPLAIALNTFATGRVVQWPMFGPHLGFLFFFAILICVSVTFVHFSEGSQFVSGRAVDGKGESKAEEEPILKKAQKIAV